jgi:hypothetical protein
MTGAVFKEALISGIKILHPAQYSTVAELTITTTITGTSTTIDMTLYPSK